LFRGIVLYVEVVGRPNENEFCSWKKEDEGEQEEEEEKSLKMWECGDRETEQNHCIKGG
jgi:hypothetical protein